MPTARMNLDTEELSALGASLKTLAADIEDADDPEALARSLERVKVITEAELPEWLEQARRSIRQFAAALAG